jgi:hypothetical protein
MRTHNGKPCRDEQTGDYCGFCSRSEDAAEERKYGIERDHMAADREAGRYEDWLDRIGGSVS